MSEENVEVLASFTRNGFINPKVFKYGQKIHTVKKINLQHCLKQGANKILVYNLSDGANDWILTYDTAKLQWTLSEFSYS